jgi:hypothetical protein
MSFTTDDYDVLRQYLLGRLAPESEEAVEARLFSDDRMFWDRLSLVEEELISDYARGALDHEQREDFEQRFLCTDERRGKGKRGGLRVIYYWWDAGFQFWLFTIYDKNEMSDLTKSQRETLKQMVKKELEVRSKQ